MQEEKEFIKRVRTEDLLYNCFRELGNFELKRQHAKWKCVAKEFGLENANKAKEKWQKLLLEYVDFLGSGGTFLYEKEMQFMQCHLLNVDLTAASQSDSEIDEFELKRALNSEDDDINEILITTDTTPTNPVKTHKITESELEKPKHLEENLQDDTTTNKQCTKVNYTVGSTSTFKELSSLEFIFLGYAKVLQKMPPSLQLQTKRKIADIMDEAERLNF